MKGRNPHVLLRKTLAVDVFIKIVNFESRADSNCDCESRRTAAAGCALAVPCVLWRYVGASEWFSTEQPVRHNAGHQQSLPHTGYQHGTALGTRSVLAGDKLQTWQWPD